MTFLNPIFLWASFAIAIPIIVHLFNFRRPKRIQFSDISLVKEVKKSVVKRMRLRQLLLLLARCLAILALVAVFANPVIRKDGAAIVQGSTSVALIVDNSYSMTGGNDKGSYWLQAQKLGRELINAYGRADEFIVMSSHEPKVNFNFGEQQAAIKELKSLEVVQNTRSLPELLALGEDIFSLASNQKKVLYFISDFQQSTILPDSGFSLSTPEGVEVNLIPLTTRQLSNAYVQDHAIATQIVEVDKPVRLELQLVNDSPEPMNNVGLRVILGTETRPVATENLLPGEGKKVEVNLIPKRGGWHSGYVELDDSPVEYDNRRYFSYYVPEREKMLVVEQNAVPNLRLMMSGQVLSQFDVKFVSFRDFGEEKLEDYKSIVLVGFEEISTGLQERLKGHLQEGKSILFFPGPNAKIASIDGFYQGLGMGTWGNAIGVEEGQYAAGVDLDHPVFDGVFVGKRTARNFDAPLVYKHYPFRPANAIVQNVILALENKDPVLVESRPEGGLFYTFTMFPATDWTDFTVKGSGFTLIVQLIRMMNQTQQVQQNEDLGGAGYKRIRTQEKEVIKMVGADSTEIIPEQFVQSGYIVLKFDKQNLKEGNYDLVQNGQLLEQISFNVPDSESQLEALNEGTLEDRLGSLGAVGLNVTPAVEGMFAEQVQMQNEGIPLWKYFLIAALVFFLMEFAILQFKTKTPATT